MGKFESYKGKTVVTVDGQKLELDIKKAEKLEILKLQRLKNQTDAEEKLYDLIDKIVKKSYPNEPEEELTAFVEKRIELILIELAIFYKWTTRETIRQLMGLEKKNEQATTKRVVPQEANARK